MNNKIFIPSVVLSVFLLTSCTTSATSSVGTGPEIIAPVESTVTPTSKPNPSKVPEQVIAPSTTAEPTLGSTLPPTLKPSPEKTESVPENTPEPVPTPKINKFEKPVTVYTITKLNVRNGPGVEYKLVDYLNKGDKLTIDAETENWSRITGTDYWVSMGYLNTKKPVDPTVEQEQRLQQKLSKLSTKYGCPSATIILDDPRLGEIANAKADWGANSILFRSTSPESRWEYLIAHECSHLIQYSIYNGDIDALTKDMNEIYGGVNYEGLEQNSDCFVFKANPLNTDYHYTRQCSGKRGTAAQSILKGIKPTIDISK